MKQLLSYLVLLVSTISLFGQVPMGKAPQVSAQDLDAILNSMTEDDFNQILNELSKLTPQELEELEREGRRILVESGIDPDTGKALAPEQALPSAPEPAKPAATALPIVTRELITSPTQIGMVLSAIQDHLANLRQKALYHDALSRRLLQWAEVLQDLVFYTKIMNKPEHHERLATKEFQPLLKNIQALYDVLKEQEPLIIVDHEIVAQDDPYEILHVNPDATQQEIAAQYARLKETYNKKKIKQRMVKEGATQKDIKREMKAAELTLSLVKDAYEQISDPQARIAFDKKRAVQQSELTASVQAHVNVLLETLSNLVYQNNLLQSFQEFLKKYEPEQLAHKQALEAAHTERKKEQEEATKRKAVTTPANFDKQRKSGQSAYPASSYQTPNSYYPADYGSYGSYGSYDQPSYTRSSSDKEDQEKKEKPSGTPGKGGASGEKKPKTEEENIEDVRKALEKQEAKKMKEESAHYKKELDELKKKSGEQKPAETGAKLVAGDQPVGEKPAQPNPVELGNQFIDNFDTLCQDMQTALKSESVRSISGHTRSGKKLDAQHCQQLIDELRLQTCFDQLKRMSNLFDSTSEEQLSKLKPAWQKIITDFGNMFKIVIDRFAKESDKYTLEEGDVKPEYVCKAGKLVSQIVARFNIISSLLSTNFKLLVEEPPQPAPAPEEQQPESPEEPQEEAASPADDDLGAPAA